MGSEGDIANSNNVAPEIITRTKHTIVEAGQSAVLSCHIRNGANAKIVWRKMDPDCMIITNTSTKFQLTYLSSGEARLLINKVEPQDSGIYVCAVSSPVSDSQRDILEYCWDPTNVLINRF